MPDHTEKNLVRAIISADKTSAELCVNADCDRSVVNEPLCLTTMLEAGIEINDAVSKELQNFIKKAKALPNKEVRHLISEAQLPKHGIDGTVNWISNDDPANKDSKKKSHYQRSAYTIVKTDDIIGTYIEAQPGIDGRDVTGKTIPAKEPLNCNINFDHTIMLNKDGDLIAQLDGVLIHKEDLATIEQLLVVDDNVDFSTGNIDFLGDIEIRRDIRDRFVVKATGNITVQGFIEDASIHCGGSLEALRGYAGRTRADAIVNGDLTTKYLDNVDAEVGNNLSVTKEVINSRLIVHGEIQSPEASFIGGTLNVSKTFIANILGSVGHVKTTIFLGSVPKLQPLADELDSVINQFNEHKDILTDKIESLNNLAAQGQLSAKEAEQQTEYTFDVQHIDATLDKATPTRENLSNRIETYRNIEVQIHKSIHANVTFITNDLVYTIEKDIRGPITITEDSQKQLVLKATGSKPQPLAEFSSVRPLTHDQRSTINNLEK
ncbi:DUF342 domain-containing protein [Planctomycetota bacterium]|nr:DUF342 domain-containing protein [Planctomycetota bacterium]